MRNKKPMAVYRRRASDNVESSWPVSGLILLLAVLLGGVMW